MNAADGAAPLVVRRSYAHSPKQIFQTFSVPKILEQWFSPSPAVTTQIIEFIFRIGG